MGERKGERKERISGYEKRDVFRENLRNLINYSNRWDSQNQFIELFNSTPPLDVTLRSGQLSEFINKGTRMPQAATLAKLADILDVSIDYLMGRTDAQTMDSAAISAAEYTGINADVLERYHNSQVFGMISKTLSYLISDYCDSAIWETTNPDNDFSFSDGSILGAVKDYFVLDFFNELNDQKFFLVKESDNAPLSGSINIEDFGIDGTGNMIILSSDIINKYYLENINSRLREKQPDALRYIKESTASIVDYWLNNMSPADISASISHLKNKAESAEADNKEESHDN